MVSYKDNFNNILAMTLLFSLIFLRHAQQPQQHPSTFLRLVRSSCSWKKSNYFEFSINLKHFKFELTNGTV